MERIINIEIKESGKGHNDLIFEIPNLISKKEFDTYYFALAIEPKFGVKEIKNAIIKLITFWIEKIIELKNKEIIYLPIDLSDQYTGCLKVEMNDNIALTYGYSRKEGWSFNPLNPSEYYKKINDFIANPKKTLTYSKIEIIQSINGLIEKLKKENVG